MSDTGLILSRVFRQPKYILLATSIAIFLMCLVVIIPNFTVFGQIIWSDDISIMQKWTFLGSMFGILGTNFSVYSAIFTILTVMLFGMNIALMVYYIKRRQTGSSATSAQITSLGGFVSGVLGIGCAACGSVVLTALFTTFGAGGLLILLPLHGAEFGLLGVVLLTYSMYQLTKRINDPLVCTA